MTRTGRTRIEIDGVKVDVMPTSPLPQPPRNSLTATSIDCSCSVIAGRSRARSRLWCGSSRQRNRGVRRSNSLWSSRRRHRSSHASSTPSTTGDDTRREKRESDALDLVRLIGDLVRTPCGAAEKFAAAPFDLAAHRLVADPALADRRCHPHGQPHQPERRQRRRSDASREHRNHRRIVRRDVGRAMRNDC